MFKKSIEVLFFGGTVPIGFLFLYFLNGVFNHPSDDDLIRYITILIFLVVLFAVLTVLFIFRENFVKNYVKDRIISLMNRKVYSINGYYIGFVKDVILQENKIYGLKIVLDSRKKKKIIIHSKDIRQYSDVVLVDSRILDKLE